MRAVVTAGSSLERAGTRTSGARPVARNVVSRFDEVDRGDVEQEAEARGDVGERPIDRQVRIGQRRRRSRRCRDIASSSTSAGTTAASARAQLLEVALVELAGPLVHEHLLELDRQRTSRPVVAPVDPAAQLAAAEPNVLPHVEVMAVGPSGAASVSMNRSTTRLQRTRSSAPVPTLTSGFVASGAGGCIGAVAPVVVGMEVEHDERAAVGEPCPTGDRARRRSRRRDPRERSTSSTGNGSRHSSRPHASSGVRYTASSRGRLRSTSNRERCATTVDPPTAVSRSVKGSSSRSRVASSSAVMRRPTVVSRGRRESRSLRPAPTRP